MTADQPSLFAPADELADELEPPRWTVENAAGTKRTTGPGIVATLIEHATRDEREPGGPCLECGRPTYPDDRDHYGDGPARTETPAYRTLRRLYCWHDAHRLTNRDPLPVGMYAEHPGTSDDTAHRTWHAHSYAAHHYYEEGPTRLHPRTYQDPADDLADRLHPIMVRGIAADAGPDYADHERWAGQWIGASTCTCATCARHAAADEWHRPPYIPPTADTPTGHPDPEDTDDRAEYRARRLAASIVTAADRGQMF